MDATISLRDVIDEILSCPEECRVFINAKTGKLVTLSDDDRSQLEDGQDEEELLEWEKDALAEIREVLSSSDYLMLPGRREYNEYEMMERFCESVEDKHLSQIMLDLIQGSGAFSRFKSAILRYDLEENWYAFRSRDYRAALAEWLDEQGLRYTDDGTE